MTGVREAEDKELLEQIKEAIKLNDGYCCCAIEKIPDTKCPCKEFRDMIKTGAVGFCQCGRYEIFEKQ